MYTFKGFVNGQLTAELLFAVNKSAVGYAEELAAGVNGGYAVCRVLKIALRVVGDDTVILFFVSRYLIICQLTVIVYDVKPFVIIK